MDILMILLLTLFIFGMAKWCNEGETNVGNVYLKGQARPTGFFVGLYLDVAEPAEDAVMGDITEPVENGYARIKLEDADWTELATKGVFQNLEKQFQANGGNWGDAYGYFVTTELTGTTGLLINAEQFSDGPYTVNDGWIVKVTPKVTIS